MPVKHDKESDLKQAQACVARALSTDSESEAISALKQARRLMKRHSASQGDVIGPQEGPRNVAREGGATIAEAAAAVRGIADTVRAVSSDPDVQKVVGGLGDLFRAVGNVAEKAAAARNGRAR